MNLILGSGGQGRDILYTLSQISHPLNALFLEDNIQSIDSKIDGILVYGTIEDAGLDFPGGKFYSAVGCPVTRRKLANRALAVGLKPGCFIKHPNVISAMLDKSLVPVANGTVAFAGSIIMRAEHIGQHVSIQMGATVGHNVVLGDYVNISPGVRLSGGCRLEEGVDIGSNACVNPKIRIGKWSIVGAGAVVTKDIPDFSVVVGVPAKKISDRILND